MGGEDSGKNIGDGEGIIGGENRDIIVKNIRPGAQSTWLLNMHC